MTTKSRNRLGVLAIAVWVPFALSLWPLPPQQIDRSVAAMHELRAKTELTPEAEKVWLTTVESLRNSGPELWAQWSLSLALLSAGIGSWTAYVFGVRFWKLAIVGSIVWLLAYLLLPNAIAYVSFFNHWLHGSTGFHLLPWGAVVATLYYHFVMPICLIVLSLLVFLLARKRTHVGSNALPI